jgi:hypothetical protein
MRLSGAPRRKMLPGCWTSSSLKPQSMATTLAYFETLKRTFFQISEFSFIEPSFLYDLISYSTITRSFEMFSAFSLVLRYRNSSQMFS